MESWTCATEEKSYLFSDEMDYSVDAFMRSRKALVEWDDKSSFNYGKDELISDTEGVKSMEFVDLGYTDLFQNSYQGSQPLETSCCDRDSNSSRRVNSSTHLIALDSSLGEEDQSVSKHSSSLVESKSPDSLLIDLKLGRLVDLKDTSGDKTVKDVLTFSSTHATMLAKRTRTSSLPTQKPVCQVYGCNMDLSSSKEYHKRHRVCDVHSKTAKVIVNGIEQRFCQQCSRFHLLAEFDDGKRSCRRRLAGHNERRRKPQCDYISGKPHRMLQSYQGTTYLAASLQKKPQFAAQDIIFHSGLFYPGKHEETNHSEHIKLEEESVYSPQLSIPITHGREFSRPSYSSCALSLLSAQSQDLSCHSAGCPISSSLSFQSNNRQSFQSNNRQQSGSQVSEIPPGENSIDKYVKNESFSYGINSAEVSKNGGIMLSDQVHGDGRFQPSNDSSNAEYCFTSENGATVDLLQLSSHLQRVQQQRNSCVEGGKGGL